MENIFLKHDDNRNNVLERRELKKWVREELQAHRFLNRKMVQKGF